jgi:hypothetical protein
MKTLGSGGIAPPFLALALDGGEWSASHLCHFTPRRRGPGTLENDYSVLIKIFFNLFNVITENEFMTLLLTYSIPLPLCNVRPSITIVLFICCSRRL